MENIPVNYKNTLIERLMSNCEKNENDCWVWTKSCVGSGYGKLRIGHTKDYMTHRLSYYVFNNHNPGKLCVLHKCDNRKCINPKHLFLGTHKQNSIDMVNKNRNVSPLSKRTHCPQGHLHTGKRNSNGLRICIICTRKRSLDWYHSNRKIIGS